MDQTNDSNKVGLEKKPKKKNHLLRLFITLAVIVTIIGGAIAGVYIAFYDGHTSQVVRDENFELKHEIALEGIRGLDDTEDTGEINFNIPIDTFNQLLIQEVDKIHSMMPDIKENFTSLYIEAKDDVYTFAADIKFNVFFKTRLKLITTLVKDEIDGETAYIFNIDDIKLGRVGGLYKLAKNLAGSILTDDFIESLLSTSGLSIKADLANNRLYYMFSSISDDINKFLDNDSLFFQTMMGEFFNLELFTMDMEEEGVSGLINLEPLSHNPNYLTKEKENNVDWRLLQANAASLVQKGLLSEEQAHEGYNFFLYGFGGLEDEEVMTKIRNADLSEYGISDPEHYTGIFVNEGDDSDGKVVRPANSLKDNVSEQVSQSILTGDYAVDGTLATIDEDMLNLTLGSSSAVGNHLMMSMFDNGTFKMNGYVVNNMYANIVDNSLRLVVSISINGYNTYCCLNLNPVSYSDYKVTFHIDGITYGESPVSDSFKASVYDLVENAWTSEDCFSFDASNENLIIDFSDSFTADQKTLIEAYGTTKVEYSGTSLSDNGSLTLKVQ